MSACVFSFVSFAALFCAVGCAPAVIPDPVLTAHDYARAAQQGDADAIYDMLDEQSQKNLSRQQVRALVASERQELQDQAKQLQLPSIRTQTRAVLRYPDGDIAILERAENGHFVIVSADALPGGSRTPTDALVQLRNALSRRSLDAFVRVLSEKNKNELQNSIDALLTGLEDPEQLDVQQRGDRATVTVAGGFVIWLRREGDTWTIEDIR